MRSERTMMNGQWMSLSMKAIVTSCLLFIVHSSWAQQASVSISKEKIVIGEQIILKIEIENLAANTVKQDFNFPDTINHLEILSDSIDGNGPSYIHTLTITSFDSGYWQFPAFELITNDDRRITTQPIDITVLPADISSMDDYHDIKDILEVEARNNWWIIAAIVAVALVSLFGFLWFVSNKKAAAPTIVPTTDIEALYNTLLNKITAAENMDASEKAAMIKIYKETPEDIRMYTDAIYHQSTRHLTTGEYMPALKGKLPDAETENSYFQFLRLADAVKFAKYIPPVDETKAIFPSLRRMIQQVYRQNISR